MGGVDDLEEHVPGMLEGHLPTFRRDWVHLESAMSPRSKSHEFCCKPSNLNYCSNCCKCLVCFMMPKVFCQIKCKGVGFACDANVLMLESEYGAADHSAHGVGGSALIPIFLLGLLMMKHTLRCFSY